MNCTKPRMLALLLLERPRKPVEDDILSVFAPRLSEEWRSVITRQVLRYPRAVRSSEVRQSDQDHIQLGSDEGDVISPLGTQPAETREAAGGRGRERGPQFVRVRMGAPRRRASRT